MYGESLKKQILEIAKDSIEDELNHKSTISKERLIKKYPELNEFKGTFVTLNLDGNLRGCIGSIIAHRPLLDDLISNAKKAAFQDPRFLPLSLEEFKDIDIEVSILSESIQIQYSDFEELKLKIRVNIDGMIVKQNHRQATFLPQVWEQLATFEEFFTHLLQKAGITDISIPIEVYTYQVEKIK